MLRKKLKNQKNSWAEWRSFYKLAAVLLLFFSLVFRFVGPSLIDKQELIFDQLVVSKLPGFFIQESRKRSPTYWAEFYFLSYKEPFSLKKGDYQYLKRGLIDRLLHIGDTVKVGYTIKGDKYNLYYLSKYDFELTGFDKAQLRKKQQRTLSLVPIFGMLVFIIPFFLKNEPKINFKGKAYSVYFGTIAFVVMLVCFLILLGIYGDEMVSGAQFLVN